VFLMSEVPLYSSLVPPVRRSDSHPATVQVSGCRFQGAGFRVQGLEFRDED
jgi:hypothetical protein